MLQRGKGRNPESRSCGRNAAAEAKQLHNGSINPPMHSPPTNHRRSPPITAAAAYLPTTNHVIDRAPSVLMRGFRLAWVGSCGPGVGAFCAASVQSQFARAGVFCISFGEPNPNERPALSAVHVESWQTKAPEFWRFCSFPRSKSVQC